MSSIQATTNMTTPRQFLISPQISARLAQPQINANQQQQNLQQMQLLQQQQQFLQTNGMQPVRRVVQHAPPMVGGSSVVVFFFQFLNFCFQKHNFKIQNIFHFFKKTFKCIENNTQKCKKLKTPNHEKDSKFTAAVVVLSIISAAMNN